LHSSTKKPTTDESGCCDKESFSSFNFLKSHDRTIPSFDGIPSSCSDLHFLGHTLSGFYLAKGIDAKVTKMETIYCDFNSKAKLKNQGLSLKLTFFFACTT